MFPRPPRTSPRIDRSRWAAPVLFLLLPASLQAQTVQWIRQFEGDGSGQVTIGNGIAADSTGVYVVGYTTSTLPGQTSAGSADAFIRKYDASGSVIWTRQFGTTGFDQAFSVAVDGTGVYVSGRTNGAFSGQSNAGSTDAFLRKYDANGNVLWTRQFGSSGDDEGIGVATGGGFVVIAGEAGAALPGQTSLGMADAFVRQYDTSGNERWTRQFGTAAIDTAQGVAADGAGVYSGGLTRGAFAGQSNAGGEDGFLQEHDHTGTSVWTRQFGTSADDEVEGVSVSTGIYAGGDTFGTLAGQSTAGSVDAFLMHVDFNGNIQWTRQFGTSGFDEGNGVTATPTGAAVAGDVAGALAGQSSAGSTDAFVRFYNSAGTVSWTQQFGSPAFDEGHGVAWDGMSQFYASGYVNGPLPGQTLNGAAGAFVARIGTGVGCSYSIAPTSQAFGAGGGSGNVSVTAGTGCAWTAVSNSGFITITSGASGSGNGSVSYSVAANSGGMSRNGTLTIAGQTFTVPQSGTSGGGSIMTISPSSLAFSGVVGEPLIRQSIQFTYPANSSFTATTREFNGTNWLRIGGGGACPVTSPGVRTCSGFYVEANFPALPQGVYQGLVLMFEGNVTPEEINSGAKLPAVTAPVSAVVTSSGSRLVASPTTATFFARSGGTGAMPQTVRIFNSGNAPMNWNIPADVQGAVPWLGFAPASGATTPGAASSVTLTANPAGLAAGVYQAVLRVSAPAAAVDSDLVVVTLLVAPSNAPPKAELARSGFVFVAQQGGANPATQALTVSNGGGSGTFTFSYAAMPASGNWLSVTPTSGSITSGPATAQVAVNAAGLNPGIYRGKVTGTFSSGPAQEMDVVLVVTPAASIVAQRELPQANSCAPSAMDFVLTTIGNGASLPVSFPRALLAEVVDNCGTAVTGATVVAAIEGRNILLQAVGGGLYNGNWTPERESAALPVGVVVAHPLYLSVQRSFTVSTSPASGGVVLPVLAPGGVVEGAGFTSLWPLAPGGIISIFGQRFATGDHPAGSVPLPTTLGGVSVRMGGSDAPLYYAGAGQVNAQMPVSARVGDQINIVVNANGRLTAPQSYLIAPAQPGVFKSGEFAAVLDSQFRPITAQNPARVGDTLQIFATGLGLTDPPASTGDYSPSFSTVQSSVAVTIGGVEMPVVYQGLAPGFVGLYQVNAVLTGIGSGTHTVVLRQNGIASNPSLPVSIPMQ